MGLAGYCSECGVYVWLAPDGSCSNGHSAGCVSGAYETPGGPAIAAPAVGPAAAFAPPAPGTASTSTEDAQLIANLARYERLSAILWIVLAVIQILGVVTIIAGIWNIYASTTRFRIAKAIEARSSGVPGAFESLTGYIVIGVINLVVGGVIGLAFVGFDLWVREKILANARLFTE